MVIGAVALTRLNGNDIVGTLQCRVFKHPADATEPETGGSGGYAQTVG
jgi:hypothetical protein